MKNKFKNPICPHCKRVLTESCFSNGKWQCRKCQSLLDYDTFSNFYFIKELPQGITLNTIFESGINNENSCMPLEWVIKNGNIKQAIIKTKQNLQYVKTYKDIDVRKANVELLENKLKVLESLTPLN